MNKAHADVKAMLERKLKELEERSERIENRLGQPSESDSQENAQLHENDEVLEGLSDLTIHEIHDIRLAISRIEHGTYGLCSKCGKEIAKERLKALPFAMTCMHCAQ